MTDAISGVTPGNAAQILPWQHARWQEMLAWRASGRLPHALLLCGMRGVGKQHFAAAFAQALLCAQPAPDGQACRACRPCLLFRAGTHPDYQKITPVEEGKSILIDQIRELNASLAFKSHGEGYKIAALWPADRMNASAANALLKTLEEPSAHTLLMLITSRPAALPATVRSRCQRMNFTLPPADLALPWLSERLGITHDAAQLLALADGAPLKAITLAHNGMPLHRAAMLEDLDGLQRGLADPVSRAAAWVEWGATDCVEWLFGFIADMIRLKSASHHPRLKNCDLDVQLQRISQRTELSVLYRHLERTQDALRLLSTQVNAQSLLEDALIGWAVDTAAVSSQPA
ncbi:MAG: DNA polymerase III subunit delta' [Proteobacteria bacterium]|nr:DNA polymerase III subunit delta' [Pseudomonadota bacterium]